MIVSYEHDGDLSERWGTASTIEKFDGEQLPPMLKQADVLYVHPTSVIPLVGRFGAAEHIPVVAHLHLPPESLRTGWKALVRGRRRLGHPEAEMFAADSGMRFPRCLRPHGPAVAALRSAGRTDRRGSQRRGPRPLPSGRRRGAGCDPRELGIEPEAIVIGFVGRIDPTKGIEQLLDVFADVVKDERNGEAVLAVLGEASRHSGGAASPYTAGLTARQVPGVSGSAAG